MHDFSTLRELLILLGSLTLVATMFHYIKIPTIVGFIITGVMIGPYAFGLIQSIPNAEILTEIAVILLMFTIGLEFSFTKLKSLQKSFWGLGLSQVVFTTLIITVLVRFTFAFPMGKSFFIGSLIAFSSTAVLLKLFEDNRQMATPVGSNCIGTLLFQDLAVIPVMLSIPILAGQTELENAVNIGTQGFISFGVKTVAVGLTIWGGSKYAIPFITAKILKTRSQELFFFFILFLCLGSAYAMGELGISFSLGAFVAGVIISGSDYGKQVVSDFVPLRDNFLGLLFCSVGMLLNLDFLWHHIGVVASLCIAVLIIKIGVVFLILKALKQTTNLAWTTGLCLFQIGELSLVLAQAGSDTGIISADEMQFILSISISSMILTPFIFTFATHHNGKASPLIFKNFIKRNSRNEETKNSSFTLISEVKTESTFIKPITHEYVAETAWQRGNHTVVIGFGIAGRNVIETMKELKIPFSIIEANYDNFKKLNSERLPATFGDATKDRILISAGIEEARLVVITVSSAVASRNILLAVRKLRPDVKIILRVQYLKEIESLTALEQTDVVVAELETSHELLARVLKIYGAPAEQISHFINQSKKEWQQSYSQFAFSHRKSIELPAWEAMAHMRPFHVKSSHFASGKSIYDLNLRNQFNVTVVTVFRNPLGTTIPSPSFVIDVGDIVQLIGSDVQLDEAAHYLKVGSIQVSGHS